MGRRETLVIGQGNGDSGVGGRLESLVPPQAHTGHGDCFPKMKEENLSLSKKVSWFNSSCLK